MKKFLNLLIFLFILIVGLKTNLPATVIARDCLPNQFCYLTCEEVCQKFPWEKICPCRKPSPTLPPKPTPTQVVQPTPTPTSIPGEPTPTLVPGEPTPTPIPSVPAEFTPTPTQAVSGGGGISGPSEPGPAGPPHCGAQTPPAPDLKYLRALGGGKVELFWDTVELATSYNISYGLSSGNYLYGVPDTGKTTSFTVGSLGTGNYCFIVRALNDCAPSGPSNERCNALGGAVLGARTKVLGATGGSINEWLMQFFGLSFLSLGLYMSHSKIGLSKYVTYS